ncbi:ribokinase [Streptomyces sp. NPDC056716]|uniref:ribokinase n=1 Tax=unclassified Streptomyces TaxID=2593676 RepID=UPI003678E4F0
MPGTVIVVGSANQDYVIACTALPRPGETRLAGRLRRFPGGKGVNQAVAAARLGGAVRFVGAVGDDSDGAFLIRELRSEGVDTSDVEITTVARTGLAFVSVLPDGENAITVVPGANFTLVADRTARAVRRLADASSIVVLQGEIPVPALRAAVETGVRCGARVVLNLAPYTELPAELLRLADPLVVNEVEAAALLGTPVAALGSPAQAAGRLAERAASAVITLGGAGAVWARGLDGATVPAPPVGQVVDTTGAGDAFVGGLATLLAEGHDLDAAVRFAVEVGTVAVTRVGAQASYPSRADVVEAGRARGQGGGRLAGRKSS